MKKSIFIVAILSAVFIFGIGIYSLSKNQSPKIKTSSLLLKNIEALANGEDGTDDGEENIGKIQCIYRGSLDCPKNHVKVKYIMDAYSLK